MSVEASLIDGRATTRSLGNIARLRLGSAEQLIRELGMIFGSWLLIFSTKAKNSMERWYTRSFWKLSMCQPSTAQPQGCEVKVNVQGGVDVQVQVNVDGI